jgi:Tfp pilus assembly protein PilF
LKETGACSNLHAVLGSFYEKLGNLDAAKQHLEKAVSLDESG